MILRSELDPKLAGVTLFETLVMLAILALVTAIAFGLQRGPSPGLELERRVSDVLKTASQYKQVAILENIVVEMNITGAGCQGGDADITYYPDGTAYGDDLCLSHENKTVRLVLNRLTGQLERVALNE